MVTGKVGHLIQYGRWGKQVEYVSEPCHEDCDGGKVMSLGLALEVATAGNVILPYHVMKITTMGNLLS